MNLPDFIHYDIAWRLGWTILHSIWQGALIVFLQATLMGLLRHRSPQSRYAASLCALVMLFGAVAVTYLLVAPPPHVPDLANIDTPSHLTVPSTATKLNLGHQPASIALSRNHDAEFAPAHSVSVDPIDNVFRSGVGYLQPAAPWIACLWGAGVFLLSIWHTGGWVAAQRLRFLDVCPVNRSVADLAGGVARRLRLSRHVRVLRSLREDTPIVIGWLRPVILLPASVLTGFAPQQLEAILAHELAHVRRHDYFVNLLQIAVEILMFYHPVVWWLSRRIRLEREHCCDDVAVAICGDRCGYVESLAAVERTRFSNRVQLAAGGSGRSQLVLRVRRILGTASVGSRDASYRVAAAAMLMSLIITFFACAHTRSPVATQKDAPITMSELIHHLAAAESAIHNLHIGQFEQVVDFQPEGKTEWQRQTYSVAGAAWYGDPNDTRFRLNISREVMEWEPEEGTAPVANPRSSVESAYDIAYDGRTGRDIRTQDGRWRIAHVYPDQFPELENRFHRYATGIEFCLSYPQPATFGKKFPGASASFQAATELGEKMILEGTKLDGRDAIKVFEATPLQGSVTFWFDPHHGYALIGYERVFQGELQESERVTSFAEAAPGVWYPASGYYEEPTRDAQAPKGRHRSSFTAKNVVANDPAFNTSIFTIDTSSAHTDIINFDVGKNDVLRTPVEATKPMAHPPTTRAAGNLAPVQPVRLMGVFVLDKATGRAIEGAKIDFDSLPGDGHAVTDAHGRADIQLGGSSNPTLVVARDGYIGNLVKWYGKGGPPPRKYLITLTPAASIGGKVVDEQGQPVAGAYMEISADLTSSTEGNVLTQTPWINRAVQTAADGSWHFDGVPPDAKEVRVGAWNPQNIKSDTVPMQQFDQHSALWTKAATLTVDSAQGVPVTGIVEGPDGRPLAGAKVAIGKDRTASQVRSPIITDAQGGFSLGVPHGSLLVLTVTADGCAPELVQALVNSDRLRLRIPLTKAHTLIGTVVDEAGRPLSHVDVAIRDWRNLLSNPQFFRTDDAGQFTWREAPGDPVTVEISAAGYVQRQLTMTAGEPVRITLQSE